MNVVRGIFFFLFLCKFTVHAQYNFSSPNAHNSIEQVIVVTDDIIKERTKDFEKKGDEKPLHFLREKKSVSQLNKISNSLSDYIKKLKKQVELEQVLYNLVDDNFFEDLLFDSQGFLTYQGDTLQIKLDSLYSVNKAINVRGFTHLKDFNENHFNTQIEYYNDKGDEVDFFNHFFYDKSNYGMLMSLNLLLLDVKTNQLLFFRTVMSY